MINPIVRTRVTEAVRALFPPPPLIDGETEDQYVARLTAHSTVDDTSRFYLLTAAYHAIVAKHSFPAAVRLMTAQQWGVWLDAAGDAFDRSGQPLSAETYDRLRAEIEAEEAAFLAEVAAAKNG